MKLITLRSGALPRLAGAGLLLLALMTPGYAGVRIHEVVTSNGGSYLDTDGDAGDWIELRNASNQIVSLLGWGISDQPDEPFRWSFPAVYLYPGSSIVVWADGKDRYADLQGTKPILHASFRLSAVGESLVLTRPDGTVADLLEIPLLPRDVSYGRHDDGWAFFAEPTPWTANKTTAYVGLMEPPAFTHPPGHYTEPVTLGILHDDPDAEIRYTLDGSLPGPGSAVFDQPLVLADRTGEPDVFSMIRTSPPDAVVEDQDFSWHPPLDIVDKVNVVRASAFRDGYLTLESATGTWFVGHGPGERYQLNVVSLVADHDDLFDHESGIYVPGLIYEENGYGEEFWGRPYANFHQRGPDWERPVHFEYFAGSSFERTAWGDLGMRIHGGGSRTLPQKSLRLYDRGQGSGNRLGFSFFEELQDTSFSRLILRNSGQDWYHFSPTMFKDAYLQRLVRHMNIEYQAYTPTVVFLNGEFWGIHNIRERIDRFYLARRYNVDPDQVDLLSGNRVVQEGSADHYETMLSFIRDYPVSDPANYAVLKTMMDVDNFIDYLIIQIYFANYDWPGVNMDYWRLQLDSYDPEAPVGHDGRWRWILYDLDFGGNGDQHGRNMFVHILNPGTMWSNPPWAVELIHELWTSDTFLEKFGNRFANHLNTTFLSERAIALADAMAEVIEPVIVRHFRRWGRDVDLDQWRANVEEMHRFARLRPVHTRMHLMQHFGFGPPVEITLTNPYPDRGVIEINDMRLDGQFHPGIEGRPYSWSGVYFRDLPVTVRAIPDEGYRFSHWREFPAFRDPEITLPPGQISSLTPEFRPVGTVYVVENDEVDIELLGIFVPLTGENTKFVAEAASDQVTLQLIDGQYLRIRGIRRGSTSVKVDFHEGVSGPETVHVPVMVYPEAHRLADQSFVFDYWSPLEPESRFPENMLFLQSEQNDPGVDAPLTRTYFIPHDDYADPSHIGLPYSNFQRTRINGLGSRGISFVNTGRERDLGAAVLAVDTRGIGDGRIEWTAGTESPNERVYGISLTYRVGLDEPFRAVVDPNGNPVRYIRSEVTRHEARMPAVAIPADALGQTYVQFKFRYHHIQGESGRRAELRLDNVHVVGKSLWELYDEWRNVSFEDAADLEDDDVSGPHADPHGTGISNLFRYVFNLDVTSDYPENPLQVVRDNPVTRLSFQSIPLNGMIRARILQSDDLVDWTRVVFDSTESEPDEHGFYHAWDEGIGTAGNSFYLLELDVPSIEGSLFR